MNDPGALLRVGALALVVLHAPLVAQGQIPMARPAQNATTAIRDESERAESFASFQRRLAGALERGDLSAALAIAEAQRTRFGGEMKAAADLAGVRLDRGDLDGAEPLYREALTGRLVEYKGDASELRGAIYLGLGRIALERGRAAEAVTHLQRAIDSAPTAARARFALAVAFAKGGDLERSDRELRAAFDVDASAALASDYVMLADSLQRAGELNEAASALATAGRLYPLDAGVRIARADALRANRQPAAALYELLYARMLARRDAPIATTIAEKIAALRAAADAATTDADPEVEAVFAYLDDAVTDQHDQALQSIHEAIRLNRGAHYVPQLLLAQSYKATGRLGQAEQILTQLVRADPTRLPALVDLADLYFVQGRDEAAGRMLERARALAPNHPRVVELGEAWAE
jgi:tetratricopeptide (TPR) repeat protein